MPVALTETKTNAPKATMTDRVTDGVRHAAHFSHQVRLMKSMARDAGEEGVYAAKRVVRRAQRSVERLHDLKDEAAYRVKREPFKAVGVAAGAGLLIGVVAGWMLRRAGRKRACKS
jgi:ElaB/YqjD/DUF883 family membrane-anchored ribosome-binding protein